MLVLSHKSLQELVFRALGIAIRVLRTSSHFVKLGVIAPKNLRVLRGELNSFEDLIESISQIKDQAHSHDFRNEPQMHILPDVLRGFDGWLSKRLQLNQLISLINQSESVAS